MNRYQANKKRIRQHLIDAAITLIMKDGYDKVTVAGICRLADYGRSTFYVYFADKEALVWEILKQMMAASDAQILEAVQTLSSPQREWVAWLTICQTVPPLRDFYQQLEGDLSRRLRQWQREHLIQTYEAQLAQGTYSLLIDVPPAISARFIVGAILEILEYWLDHPELGDAEIVAGHFFRLVFRQNPPSTPTTK